jgi:1,4-dihydroxy-2-naphthoate octaprenyltransferase
MIKNWLDAFRLRTLPLSLSGILMGSFIAFDNGFVDFRIFGLALITTILFQILSNLANDLGDSLKGTDNSNRVGPLRTVQSGAISKSQMKTAVILTALFSFVSAGSLVFIAHENMSSELIIAYCILTVFCISAAILYTISNYAYGYKGFGDLMVFIFFGVVAVMGSNTLYSKSIDYTILLPSCTIGLLSMAVLNLNNMRDHENDALSNKITVVVQMGFNRAKTYHFLLLILSFITLCLFILVQKKFGLFLATLPYLGLFPHWLKVKNCNDPRELDTELKKVALSTFFMSVLVGIGLLIF